MAEKANVSVTTVSRVLNNRPDVSDETRKRIKNIIESLGYNSNSIAEGLILRRSFTIGLAIPSISNPFFPEVAKGGSQ
jgi:LacI family transcriptional regulator